VIRNTISYFPNKDIIEINGDFIEDVKGKEIFDFVILGNVLCEVPDVEATLFHVNRLLKRGGKVYFSEHVSSDSGTLLRYLQYVMSPMWCNLTDGCNINRDTLNSLENVKNW
jgi:2-polyprenyl-3-methyl-5-hydroxy-6-metoxy-1,4-benzoquinol methylase